MFASTGGGHRRTDDGELNAAGEEGGGGGGGEDKMTRTERRQRNREETGELQGTENPGDSGRFLKMVKGKKRETGGPEPPSDGKDSKLNIDGTESRVDGAAVRERW